MKNYVLSTVMMLMVGFSLSAQVSQNIQIESIPLEKKLSVVFKNGMKDGTITIYDQVGKIVWNEATAASTQIGKVFDLDQLPKGTYEVVVKTNTREVAQKFEVDFSTLSLKGFERREYFTPSFNVSDNNIDITFFNNRVGDVAVSIIDAKGNTVFEEEHENIVTLQKRYQVVTQEEGEFTVVLKTPEKAYYKQVILD